MIATWMLYCSLCALGLAGAAALAERALLGGRASVRFLWLGAVVLSLLVPAVAFRFAARRPAPDTPATIDHVAANRVSNGIVNGNAAIARPTTSAPLAEVARPRPARPDWRAVLARLDGPLAIAWVTLSLAVVFDFLGGIVVLALMRRRWQRRTVLGIPVFVSERTGPAVVGALSPAIVLPEWVLSLDRAQLALMLRHEQEHRRVGDGRLITAAKLSLIVMPWNLALWWQILRLRAAVELDCDARVLREADARSYGDLLLEMARPRRGPNLMGATAFAERATQLERRIRVLPRHHARTTRTARALAAGIGMVALTVAWAAPHPALPARVSATPATQGLADRSLERSLPATQVAPVTLTEQQNAAVSTATPASAALRRVQIIAMYPPRLPDAGVVSNTLLPSAPLLPCARAGGPEVAPVVDEIFNRIFAGITLSREREARACDILIGLHTQQLLNDQAVTLATLANQQKRVQRDAELRALLTNDLDRATFDARIAPPAGRGGRGGGAEGGRGGGGGGRARSGGAAADTVARAARGGRGGARGGGVGVDTLAGMRTAARALVDAQALAERQVARRGEQAAGARGGGGGGGRGTLGDLTRDTVLLIQFSAQANEANFRRLFTDIQLTAEQEARARELISNHDRELREQRPPRREMIMRVNAATGAISMRAESLAELVALVSSEADRATIESRVTVVPR